MRLKTGSGFRTYDARVINSWPVFAYARLHVLLPLALVATFSLGLVGLFLPQSRYEVSAASVLTGRPSREYNAAQKTYTNNFGTFTSTALTREQVAKVQKQRKLAIARAEKQMSTAVEQGRLGFCRENTSSSDTYETCAGAEIDSHIRVLFWLFSFGSAAMLIWWMLVTMRDAWMLPCAPGNLWFTPVFLASILSIIAPPLVMYSTLYARASSYVIAPSQWILFDGVRALVLVGSAQISVIWLVTLQERIRVPLRALISGGFALLFAAERFLRFPFLLSVVLTTLSAYCSLFSIYAVLSDGHAWAGRLVRMSRFLLPSWVAALTLAVLHFFNGEPFTELRAGVRWCFYVSFVLWVFASRTAELEGRAVRTSARLFPWLRRSQP